MRVGDGRRDREPDRADCRRRGQATGEMTGSGTIGGAAKRTADAIAAQLKKAAQEQGWI